MKRWTFLLGIIMIFNLGCNHDHQIRKSAQAFAPLECKAILLREERFRLAAKLRNLEEDLPAYELGKDSLLLLAEDLKNRSALLGDTIKRYLDSLFANHLKDKKSKIRFTDLVRKLNEEAGCGK